ncbi:OmpA family protein [Labrys monachus]|uniref:Outer membrane protein OmpA-like peptidoglycan-associated protein n=1 Tax=Labrys monachus TaxID=217067 RepID=A0ABU0FE11_9HYPH|nr:OmpA family protein [Labrys monachus]MDQ0392358.1 outer membrane protein OmpA-like peptidoglycan-associated protein [Labrys monachus]
MMRAFLMPLAAAGFCLAAALPALADCASLDASVKAAIASGNPSTLPALADAIARDTSCDSAYVDVARRNMALAYMLAGEQPDGSYGPDYVVGAAKIARPWQVAMALGDLDYEAKNYPAAVEAYEAAINDIRDAKRVPKAPSRQTEEYLAKRAYQAKSLAPTYIASRGFRGEPEGVMVPTFRNFTAVSVPVPIRFDTDQATLTPDGEKAVDDLYNYLKTQSIGQLVLVGHTDERGSAPHNMALSKARATTVAMALQRRGLAIAIDIEGHGDHEPFAADDRSKYSRDELYAFDRRVEFEVH